MGNIKVWIIDWLKENKLEIKDIESIVIGPIGDSWIHKETIKICNPNEGLTELDREFDDGFGGEEGHSFYVYLKDWILFKTQYDGSESMSQIPRNPNDRYEPRSAL